MSRRKKEKEKGGKKRKKRKKEGKKKEKEKISRAYVPKLSRLLRRLMGAKVLI